MYVMQEDAHVFMLAQLHLPYVRRVLRISIIVHTLLMSVAVLLYMAISTVALRGMCLVLTPCTLFRLKGTLAVAL
jgi:hypothetical protein